VRSPILIAVALILVTLIVTSATTSNNIDIELLKYDVQAIKDWINATDKQTVKDDFAGQHRAILGQVYTLDTKVSTMQQQVNDLDRLVWACLGCLALIIAEIIVRLLRIRSSNGKIKGAAG
jgi:hypothetical protein